MKLSFYHVTGWIKRHGPAWLKGVKLPIMDSLDGVINARGGIRFTTSQHNALNAIRMIRNEMRRKKKTEVDLINALLGYSDSMSCARQDIVRRIGRKALKNREKRNQKEMSNGTN